MKLFIEVFFMIICILSTNASPAPALTKVFNNLVRHSNTEWWNKALFYQIYPRSFKDSDNDGNGDLQGIIEKLDHFKHIGVDAIILSSIYKSPQVDNGYDITDHKDIDEIYGSLDDLQQLIDETHKLGVKIILDYVPNHTSDKHKWFQASVKRKSGFEDFYVWNDGVVIDGQRNPPNNWISIYGGSAWEWNEERQQYYLHQYSASQPDLNFRNANVVNEMKDILSYWLDFGIDGFRISSVSYLFEDALFQDEPVSDNLEAAPGDYDFLDHIYTADLNETYEIVYEFRKLLDQFNEANGSYNRIMIIESNSSLDKIIPYSGYHPGKPPGAHIISNVYTFIHRLKKGFDTYDLGYGLMDWMEKTSPYGIVDHWMLGNQDYARVATRLGTENVDALNMFLTLLPGVQVVYNGEEIGQENGEVTCEQGRDQQALNNCSNFNEKSRDFERTPFQWSSEINAGFNDGAEPWLPVSQQYKKTNLEAQSTKDLNSHYNIFKQMSEIRKILKHQNIDWIIPIVSRQLFALRRFMMDLNVEFTLLFNVSDNETLPDASLPSNGTVLARNPVSDYQIGDVYDLTRPLKGKEAVLFRYEYKPKI